MILALFFIPNGFFSSSSKLSDSFKENCQILSNVNFYILSYLLFPILYGNQLHYNPPAPLSSSF